jgi:hypothetical protein
MRILTRRSQLSAVIALVLLAPAVARAQSTQQQIDSAIALYDAFQVEAARPILIKIISPGYTQQVSSKERAQAYKYLGASAAVLASGGDSAITYFQGALDFDPFTDLDPTKFAAAEQAAFSEAKRRLFKVAIRPLSEPSLVWRGGGSVRFELITTQRANLRVDLAGPRDTVLLYEGLNDGVRTVPWEGITNAGTYASAGVYQLRVRGTQSSASSPLTLTETMTIRVEHVLEPLEDTLPALDPANPDHLLPERIRSTEPWMDLAKGVGLAVVAVGIPLAALETTDIAWAPHAGTTAVIALSSAGISYWYRRTKPQIKANVAENSVRRRYRDTFNAAVRERNQARLERTRLIISPVTGLGQ